MYVTHSLDAAVRAKFFSQKISPLHIDTQIFSTVLLRKEIKIWIKKLGHDTVQIAPGEISSGKPKALLLIRGVNSSNANTEAMWSNF